VAQLLIKEMLKKKKISKRLFAKMIGSRYDNVFRIFRDGYDPKLSTLTVWAKSLGCRVRDLIKE
jgi:DNA-binding Xre family transcriptional regulator